MFCGCLLPLGPLTDPSPACPLTDTWTAGLTVTVSMGLVTFACCPAEPLSLVLDTGGVFGCSHVAVGGFVEAVLSPEQPPLRLPGLSCSSMAKANISSCSEVNVNVPKEPDDALIPWPWGSMDATEKPLPPPAPVDMGESVCLLEVKGCSIV